MIHNDLLSVSEAQKRILGTISQIEKTSVPLAQAVSRILAETITAELDFPLFPNSSMDGFAVRAEDVSAANENNPVVLSVVADIPAGEVPEVIVGAGGAARIMTGAQLPDGADAVVPVEATDYNTRVMGVKAPKQVQILEAVRAGENIRPEGQDIRQGEIVLNKGMRLRAQDIGLLAMLGVNKVPAYRFPKIAVFSTGDELLPADMPLVPGKIYESNTYMLVSLIERYGGVALNLGIVPDRAGAVKEVLDQAVGENVDLIISSAGVSVGAFDFVRSVVEEYGTLNFWRVNMRPGKPLAFGEYQNVRFIGLPGNPVSAYVGFEVFVRPALLKLAGLLEHERFVQKVKLLEQVESDGRASYLRAVVHNREGNWVAQLTGHQGSGNLRSLSQANALLLVPPGVKFLPTDTEVDAWLLD